MIEETKCPNCDSGKMIKYGSGDDSTGEFEAYECQECGEIIKVYY